MKQRRSDYAVVSIQKLRRFVIESIASFNLLLLSYAETPKVSYLYQNFFYRRQQRYQSFVLARLCVF